jgi:hypothetical protein
LSSVATYDLDRFVNVDSGNITHPSVLMSEFWEEPRHLLFFRLFHHVGGRLFWRPNLTLSCSAERKEGRIPPCGEASMSCKITIIHVVLAILMFIIPIRTYFQYLTLIFPHRILRVSHRRRICDSQRLKMFNVEFVVVFIIYFRTEFYIVGCSDSFVVPRTGTMLL